VKKDAEKYVKEENKSGACAKYKELLSLNPKDSDAEEWIKMNCGNPEPKKPVSPEKPPVSQNFDNIYNEAKAFFDKGDYVNAEKKYGEWEKLSNKKNTTERTKARRCINVKNDADLYYKVGNMSLACEKYKELLSQNSKDINARQRINECCNIPNPYTHYKEALDFFDRGDYENAEKKYGEWEKLSNKKNTDELTKVKKCIAAKNDADLYYKVGNNNFACKKYEELLSLNPKDSYAKQQINKCCYQPTVQEKSVLNVSKENIIFDAYGGEEGMKIMDNSWTVSGNIAWCTARKSASVLTLICEPNTSSNERRGTLTVNAGNRQININVEQEFADNPLALGKQFFDEGRYDLAIKMYEMGAKNNNTECYNRLGGMYVDGLGVGINDDKAIEFFKKSAEGGNAAGQNNLGMMYEFQKNYEKAVEWYRKSAYKGYALAQYNLGLMYEYGYGVKKNKSEAYRWYRKSQLPEAWERLKINKQQ
jgi:tetratricopeptide (TPR) repeat protein